MKILITLCLCLICSFVFAETRKALIYDIGKTNEKPRFTQETEIIDKDGNVKVSTSKITDSEGKVVMTEKATMKDGKVVQQYIEQLQVNEAYELEVQGKKATFKTYKLAPPSPAKLTETKVQDIDESFMTGPMTESVIQKNWAELVGGQVLNVDFGIFELSKVIGFEFKKMKDDSKKIELRMKPSSFFISAVVDPITIEFNKDNKRMIRFVGRTPLQQKIETRWKAMDAEIIYQ